MAPVMKLSGQLIESFNRFNLTASRRDKWFRLVQYLSRWIVLHATSKGMDKMEIIIKLKKLESNVGQSRKLYRIFGSIDFVQKAYEIYRKPTVDNLNRWTNVTANAAKAVWLFFDHFLWFGKIGLIKIDAESLGRKSAWCWFVALGCLIIRDLKLLTDIDTQIQRLKNHARDNSDAVTELHKKRMEWKATRTELIKDCLDLTLPSATLGRIPPKFAAFCGLISTIITIKQEWKKL